MAALTQDIIREQDTLPELPPNLCHTQLQNTTIFQNAVAMHVAGVARPAATGVAGSAMLGVSVRRYTAPAGSNKTYPDEGAMVFKRGVFAFGGLAGDLPTEALLNKPVYFQDDNTVKATMAANDISGILRFIKNGFYWVEVG